MAKHYIRQTSPHRIPVLGRKSVKWLAAPGAGPHKKNESVSATSLLRDFLGIAKTASEAERIMSEGNFLGDGKKVTKGSFPVGFMDVVYLPLEKKHYVITIKNGKFACAPKTGETDRKYCQVAKKHTMPGAKQVCTMHDGRTMPADKGLAVGDTVVMEVPSGKLVRLLKRQEGAKCIITSGKHAGTLAIVGKILERVGSMGN
ncbi:hypothetical protein COV61_00635, partial [Candidatus Micrarchaeota archaeon CG11_big_fil_rev_8_21_14_0_20_47_5]